MWRKRIMAMAAVSLAVAVSAAGTAQARDDDTRTDWQDERGAETQLGVPRVADGTIDLQGLVNGVDDLVARGVREIEFRDGTLTQDEARNLVLRIEGNLLGDLATRLPNDGIPRAITVTGPVDFSVQRQANGELFARIDDIFVGSPTEARRAEFTQQLAAQYGFDRLQIGGVDAAGNHVRVEFDADRGILRNEALAAPLDSGGDHGDRHGKRRAEAQVAVPRSADGKTIDVPALLNGVDDLVDSGVRQIHFRHGTLTQDDAKLLILQTGGKLIGDLATRLPNDGIQRQITLRGDVDLRVQRLANGELRASIKDLVVENPTEARRAEFTRLLAEQYDLDRLTIRAIDAQGNRIRVEFRDGVIVRNEVGAGHHDGGKHHADRRKDKDKDRDEDRAKWAKHHGDRDDRADRRKERDDDHADHRKHHREDHADHNKHHRGHRADHRDDRRDRAERRERGDGREDRADRRENGREDRAERGEHRDGREHRADRRDNGRVDRAVWREREHREGRSEKFIKVERQERVERPERPEQRSERAERQANFDRPERPERNTKFERPGRPERAERVERVERRERAERAERPERRERAERAERVERPDRKGRD